MENHICHRISGWNVPRYISRPAKLPAPTVVVLQELFGVNADIRATCDELATQGFIRDRARPLLAARAWKSISREVRSRMATRSTIVHRV